MQSMRWNSWRGVFLVALMCLAVPATAGDKPEKAPSTGAVVDVAKGTVTKIMSKSGLKIEAGSVKALSTILSNWDTIKNPCPCTLRLLDAMFKGLRDGEGQSFAFVMVDCFKVPQLGGGTFAELQIEGEYLSNELARNKAQNLDTLRRMRNEVRAACAPPSQTTPPPPTPPPPPPRPPPTPPPPPPPSTEVWTAAHPCPACQAWADLLATERANIEKANKALQDLRAKLSALAGRKRKLNGEIKALELQLARQQGTGGSSYDPNTGVRVEAVTDANGTVHVTIWDGDGNIIEQYTRERRDTGKIKDEIKAKQAELKGLDDQEAQLKKDIDYQNALKAKAERGAKVAQEGLDDCIRDKCNPPGGTAYNDGRSGFICPRPRADQPMVIGSNSRVGSGAQARDEMREQVGKLLGGLISGGSSSRSDDRNSDDRHSDNRESENRHSGNWMSDNNQPRTDHDPISDKDKQTFTAADGTRLRIGGRLTSRGARISMEIGNSPGKGTFQTVFLEDAQGRRMGPMKYQIHDMYQDWQQAVSWRRDPGDNDDHVSREERDWSDKGRDFLGMFSLPRADEGIWRRMGFNNATRGIKALGVDFVNPLQALATGPAATSLVVHVSRPREDPVTTTPFIFSMVAMPDGRLEFQPLQRTLAQDRCRDD